MAEMFDMAGNAIDIEKPGRDSKIAACLDDLGAQNDAGRISYVFCVYITPEGWYGATWAASKSAGAVSGLLGVGALEALKAELLADLREAPEVSAPDTA